MNIRRAIFYTLTLFASMIHITIMSIETAAVDGVPGQMYVPEPLPDLFPTLTMLQKQLIEARSQQLASIALTDLHSKRTREDNFSSDDDEVLAAHKKQKLSIESRPFICFFEHCNKSFTRQRDLSRHMIITHTRWICTTCNKVLGAKDSLKKHKSTHNHRRQRFICKICNASYVAQDGLKHHILKYHTTPQQLQEIAFIYPSQISIQS